jgi:hypothetical protein
LFPNQEQVSNNIATLRDGFLTKFPLGYLTDFVTILTSSTTGSLPAINVTLPSGMIGAGAHINLDLTNVLAPVLDATTSQFFGTSAPDSGTFFDITNRYWDYFVYMGLALYFISRIVGSHVISRLRHRA